MIVFRSKRNLKKNEGLSSLFSEAEITDIKCFVCFIVKTNLYCLLQVIYLRRVEESL